MKNSDPEIRLEQGDDGFYSRWSKRKQALREQQQETADDQLSATAEETQPPALTDEDMPPLEALHEGSDYSGFLSPKVSDELRRLALRKLFHAASFNQCDGLDDYAEDYTSFEKLGDIITSDMRFQMEQEARKLAQQALADAEPETGQEQEQEQQERPPGDEPLASSQDEIADTPETLEREDHDTEFGV
jgi:hypothetical protein